MALLPFTSRVPFAFSENPKPLPFSSIFSTTATTTTQFSTLTFFPLSSDSFRLPRFPSLRSRSSVSGGTPGPISGGGDASENPPGTPSKIADEWGEKSEPEAPDTKLPDADPPRNEDEWEEGGADDEYIDRGNGSPTMTIKDQTEGPDDKLEGLKRALVDTVYGTEFGFRAGSEVRAEVSELVTQLEAANPTPAPVEEPGLNGTWVLL